MVETVCVKQNFKKIPLYLCDIGRHKSKVEFRHIHAAQECGEGLNKPTTIFSLPK